ncbi:hypothetical protein [Streptomyces sp. cg2]|uniref:hypothetical protein n=1 Tax=Streptomyces sp. cg2 TaxID=3238799 RepID=UPI0034E2EEE8
MGDDAALERRELGDAAMLADSALGYLLGTEQQITVTGAEHAEEAPPAGATEVAAVQQRLRQWVEKELLPLRVQHTEHNAVGRVAGSRCCDPATRPLMLDAEAGSTSIINGSRNSL